MEEPVACQNIIQHCFITNLMHYKRPTTALLFSLISNIVPSVHTQPTNNNASTLPITTGNSNTIIPFSLQTSPATNAAVTCTPFKPFHFQTTYQDCSAAIRLLPDSPKEGPFHTGGRADDFRLPIKKSVKTCEIEVRMADAYTGAVMGAWREIKNAAAVVAETCYNGRGIESTGGKVLLGRVLVSVVRAGSIIVSGVENSTIAGEN